jgi:hypothetical protein
MVVEGLRTSRSRSLSISEDRQGHLTSVFRQIGVTDRTQAALWAGATASRERPAYGQDERPIVRAVTARS